MSRKFTATALAAGVLALGLSATANAQDAAATRWSGLYGGAVVGYSDGRANVKDAPLNTQAGSPFFGSFGGARANADSDFKLRGGEYGATLGWNYQSGHMVAGFEGDLSYSDVDGHRTFAGQPSAATNTNLAGDMKYLATVRTRLGYATGPALLYATGGFAASEMRFNRSFANASSATLSGDDDRRYMGFTYGAGGEYALGPKWSVKAEYLRLNLGERMFRNGYTDGSFGMSKVRLDRDVYRMGVNYRF